MADAYAFLVEAIHTYGVIGWPNYEKYEEVKRTLMLGSRTIGENLDEEVVQQFREQWAKFTAHSIIPIPEGLLDCSNIGRIKDKYRGESALPIIQELWPDPGHCPDWVTSMFPEYFYYEDIEETFIFKKVRYIP